MTKLTGNDIDTTSYSESMKKLMVNQMIDSRMVLLLQQRLTGFKDLNRN